LEKLENGEFLEDEGLPSKCTGERRSLGVDLIHLAQRKCKASFFSRG
jgi:hypothetical protein